MAIFKGILVPILALAILLAACAAEKKEAAGSTGEAVTAVKQAAMARENDKNDAADGNRANGVTGTTYKISKGSYSVDDPVMTVKINYPQITNWGDIDRQIAINEILKKAALRYGKYDVEPELFTDKYKGSPDRYWAEVEYEIKWQSENVLSVLYMGSKHFPRRPHPNHYLDGVNIDVKKGQIIKMSDLVNIDESFGFAEKFQAGKFKPVWPSLVGHVFFSNDPEMKKEGTAFSDARLVDMFAKSFNNYYLTKDSLVIIVPVIFALGGAAEFEIKYEDITTHIKHENELWRDFATAKQ